MVKDIVSNMDMELTQEMLELLNKRGYAILYTKGFYENYESEDYVIAMKDSQPMMTRFSYCSCNGLHDETVDSIINSLKPITPQLIKDHKTEIYIEESEQMKFLDELLEDHVIGIR